MIQTHKGSHPPPIYFAPRGTHHGSHLINHRSASVRISLMSFTGLSLVSTSQLFNTSLGSQLYTAVWDAKTKIQGFRSAFGNCKKGIIFRKEMKIGVSQIEIPQQNLLCFCCFLLRLCQIRGQNLLSFWQLQELSTPQDLQATNNSTKPRYCPDVERTFSLDSVNEKKILIGRRCPCLRSALSYTLRRFDLSLDKRLTSCERWNSPVTLPSEILQAQSFRLAN